MTKEDKDLIELYTKRKLNNHKYNIDRLEERNRKSNEWHERLKQGFNEYSSELEEVNTKLDKQRAIDKKKEFEKRVQYTKEQEAKLIVLRKYSNAIRDINIDELRNKPKLMQLLKYLEHKTTECPKICSKCAYRNYENGLCWYLMMNDRPASRDDKKCNHFVDAIEFLEKGRN